MEISRDELLGLVEIAIREVERQCLTEKIKLDIMNVVNQKVDDKVLELFNKVK